MTSDETSAYIAATADTLGLTIRPEWKDNVTRFFDVAKDMAALVTASGALTDAEQAPIFEPKDAESRDAE
jgi:hypothetical protein